MSMNRRTLITGLISLVAAPAIVRVQNIMPVKQVFEPFFEWPTRLRVSDSLRVYHSEECNPRYICTRAGVTSGLWQDWIDGVPKGSTAKFIRDWSSNG